MTNITRAPTMKKLRGKVNEEERKLSMQETLGAITAPPGIKRKKI